MQNIASCICSLRWQSYKSCISPSPKHSSLTVRINTFHILRCLALYLLGKVLLVLIHFTCSFLSAFWRYFKEHSLHITSCWVSFEEGKCKRASAYYYSFFFFFERLTSVSFDQSRTYSSSLRSHSLYYGPNLISLPCCNLLYTTCKGILKWKYSYLKTGIK